MKTTAKAILVAFSIVVISCSSEPKWETAHIEGKISVADSLDSSGDFSGISLIISHRENPEADIDTLFNEVTNEKGEFNSKLKFPDQGVYPLYFSRNGNLLGVSQIILADKDTSKITGELPGLDQTLKIDSREQRGMDQFNNITKGFNRVAAYINAGAIEDSLVEPEVRKWSNLYWEVADKHKGTLAENLAMTESIRLLELVDMNSMMEKIDRALSRNDRMVLTASSYGFQFVSSTNGIDNGIAYLDSLIDLTEKDDLLINLRQRKVEAYYDSSRISEAQNSLSEFEKLYKENSRAMEWAKTIGYDLDYLAPGYRVPDFSFVTQAGDSVNSSKLIGKPYILEITAVASGLYQQQYDRTVVIHQIYQNYDLEVYTIPLDRNEVTVEAFFEDRVRHWDVAKFGTFDIKRLIEKFNVTDVPTRILVDQQGNIVRKYVTTEFTDVIQGMNTIISQTNRES